MSSPRLPVHGARSGSTRPQRLREWLLGFLRDCPDGVLPSAAEIARRYRTATGEQADAYLVCGAFDALASQGRIRHRSGTRSLHRGHRAVRIVATGKVLKTAGCPFEVAGMQPALAGAA